MTMLLLLTLAAVRQESGGKSSSWTLEEMELVDWMAANNKQPGDDMSEFFKEQ